MKNIILIISVLFFGVSNSQNYLQEDIVQLSAEKLFFIEQESINLNQLNRNSLNTVYISQEGINNFSSVIIQANKSEVKIKQHGDDNIVDIDVKANEVYETVNQIGTGHQFIDHNKFGGRLHEVEVLQLGKNHKIVMQGKNNLSEGIKITQQGSNKTIYINNFK